MKTPTNKHTEMFCDQSEMQWAVDILNCITLCIVNNLPLLRCSLYPSNIDCSHNTLAMASLDKHQTLPGRKTILASPLRDVQTHYGQC